MALSCTMHSTYAAFFKREGLLYVSNLTHACSHFSSVIPTINTTKEVPYITFLNIAKKNIDAAEAESKIHYIWLQSSFKCLIGCYFF